MGDGELPYGKVIHAIDVAQGAGVDRVGVVTESMRQSAQSSAASRYRDLRGLAKAAKKRKGRAVSAAPFLRSLRDPTVLAALDTGGFVAHAHRHDADLLDAGALGGVDHLDDLAVAQRRVADDEHRLF